MADASMVHGWVCVRCRHQYTGLLRWHTCMNCGARDRYVLEWTEVTLTGLYAVPDAEDDRWEHDARSGRSRYWHQD